MEAILWLKSLAFSMKAKTSKVCLCDIQISWFWEYAIEWNGLSRWCFVNQIPKNIFWCQVKPFLMKLRLCLLPWWIEWYLKGCDMQCHTFFRMALKRVPYVIQLVSHVRKRVVIFSVIRQQNLLHKLLSQLRKRVNTFDVICCWNELLMLVKHFPR